DIALHEMRWQADGDELVAVERFVEEAAFVAEHLWLEHQAAGKIGLDDFHQAIGPCSSNPSRYWPYPFFASGSASALSCASSIQPLFQAISSGQHTRRPWRFSMVSM